MAFIYLQAIYVPLHCRLLASRHLVRFEMSLQCLLTVESGMNGVGVGTNCSRYPVPVLAQSIRDKRYRLGAGGHDRR